MRAFYDWCHHLALAATALTGTGSFFVSLAGSLGITQILTGIVAMASSIDFVFRFERKARLHAALCQRFTRLARKLAAWEPTPANLTKAQTARLEIEENEPPVRRLIDLQAQNEECRARGIAAEYCIPLTRRQRKLGYVITWDMKRLEDWENQQSERRKLASSAPAASENG
jgi:hypothetical protein